MDKVPRRGQAHNSCSINAGFRIIHLPLFCALWDVHGTAGWLEMEMKCVLHPGKCRGGNGRRCPLPTLPLCCGPSLPLARAVLTCSSRFLCFPSLSCPPLLLQAGPPSTPAALSFALPPSAPELSCSGTRACPLPSLHPVLPCCKPPHRKAPCTPSTGPHSTPWP